MAIEIAPGIVVDNNIRFGKPVIRGTRIPVSLVLAKLAAGMSSQDLAAEYDLSYLDVQAPLQYAANLVAGESILVTA